MVQSRVSALFLTAPEDGVAPGILLTVQDNRGKPFAQYLYNVPDGASRLMLEHRARPGLQLNALFLSGTSPAEVGGLGGLVLRLKQDGHANLQLVGPHGEQQGTVLMLISCCWCRQHCREQTRGLCWLQVC
jgi:ribonuclease Z